MTVTPKTIAIVLAAGRGTRAGGSEPKQWQTVLGKPLLAWSLDAFLSNDDIDAVVLVHHPDDQGLIAQLPASVRCLYGGANRDDSVRCALEALKEQAPDYVLIHDAARPMCHPISDIQLPEVHARPWCGGTSCRGARHLVARC
jgi:2-C-methyl-D-erythritol 4-phosphate cytidylyltransferase/2-C-methyl-D-erythritol 2,4-cyclodiphosphate synthase